MEGSTKPELDPEAAGLTEDEGRSGGSGGSGSRWYQGASFWLGPFTIGIGLLVALGLAAGWYVLGGFPRGHDHYGAVEVPGQQVLNLPEGEVRVNYEDDAVGGGESRSISDQPEGLEVRIMPAGGGDPIEVEDVPSWLFSSISEDRGHEPLGKAEIPSGGDYRVQATDDATGGFNSPEARRAAPGNDSGPEVTIGEQPWTPLDSPLLGAILVFCLVAAVSIGSSLALRRFVK